jgi:hypothetical protein
LEVVGDVPTVTHEAAGVHAELARRLLTAVSTPASAACKALARTKCWRAAPRSARLRVIAAVKSIMTTPITYRLSMNRNPRSWGVRRITPRPPEWCIKRPPIVLVRRPGNPFARHHAGSAAQPSAGDP